MDCPVIKGNFSNDTRLFDELMVVPIAPLSKIDTFLHIMFISQGIPINLFISLVFILNKQLQTPRNSFWIGIIVVNLLTILIAGLRLMLTYSNTIATKDDNEKDGIVCYLFSFLTGKPYTLLLLIQLLATLDRYYSQSSPNLFYQKYFTVRFIAGVQLCGFLFIFFFTSLPHLIGSAPLRCGFNLEIGKSNVLIRCVLILLSFFYYIGNIVRNRRNVRKRQKVVLKKKLALRAKKNRDKQRVKVTIYDGEAGVEVNKFTTLEAQKDAEQNKATMETIVKPDEPKDPATVPGKGTTSMTNSPPVSTTSSGDDNNADPQEEEEEYTEDWEVEEMAKLLVDTLNMMIVFCPAILILILPGSLQKHLCEDASELSTAAPTMGLAFFMYTVYLPLIYCFISKDFSKAARRMLCNSTPSKDGKNQKLMSSP